MHPELCDLVVDLTTVGKELDTLLAIVECEHLSRQILTWEAPKRVASYVRSEPCDIKVSNSFDVFSVYELDLSGSDDDNVQDQEKGNEVAKSSGFGNFCADKKCRRVHFRHYAGQSEDDYVLECAIIENAGLLARLENSMDSRVRVVNQFRCTQTTKGKRCNRRCHGGPFPCSHCVIHCAHRSQFPGAINHMKVPRMNAKMTHLGPYGVEPVMATDEEFEAFIGELSERSAKQIELQRAIDLRKFLRSNRGPAQGGDHFWFEKELCRREQRKAKLTKKEKLFREEDSDKRSRVRDEVERRNARDEKFERQYGNAQIGFDIKMEHIFKVPLVEDFLAMCHSRNNDVDFRYVVKEFCLACLHMYQAGFSFSSITTSLFHFLSNIKAGEEMMKFVMEMARKIFMPNAEGPTQNISPGMIVSGGFTLLGVIIVALTGKSIPNAKGVDEFLMKMTRLGSSLNCVDKLQDKIGPLLEHLVDYVRVQWFGYSSSMLDEWKVYNEFCDEVTALNTSNFERDIRTDEKLKNRIDELLQRSDQIMRSLDSMRIPPAQRSRFTSCHMFLQKARIEASNSAAGMMIPRVPPVLFHFIGATGVGKSEMTHRLNAKLLASIGITDPRALHSQIYFRTPGQDRFDGFKTEMKGCVCDDFGAMKDTAQNPSGEPFEALKMQNSAVWPLSMAHLSDKGNVFFRCLWVLWSSNRATFNFDSVTNPEAILRRVTLKFVHRPHPDFAKVKNIGGVQVLTLDEEKVDAAAETDKSIYNKCWLFDQICPQSSGGVEQFVYLKRDLTFNEVAKMCVDALSKRQKAGKKKLDYLDEFFEECVKEAGNAQIWPFNSEEEDEEDGGPPIHIKLWEAMDKYTPCRINEVNAQGNPLEWPHFDYGFLRGAGCVRVRQERQRERIERAYVSAMAYSEMFEADDEIGYTPEQRDERFSFAFWQLTNIPPGQFTLCQKHTGIPRFEKFMQKLREYTAWMKEQAAAWTPWWIDVAFETFARMVVGFLIGYIVGEIVHRIISACVRWKYSKQEMLDYYETVFTPEDAKLICEMYWGYAEGRRPLIIESRQDVTPGARPKNVESQQDRTAGATRKNVESAQDKTSGATRKNVESEETGHTEALSDVNAMEIARKVQQNVWSISLKVGERFVVAGTLFFIGGRVAITNAHIAKALKGLCRVENDDCRAGIEFHSSALNIAYLNESEEKDVAIIEFPRSMRLHQDMRRYFMTREDFCHHTELRKMMMIGLDAQSRVRSSVTMDVKAMDRVKFDLNDGKEIRQIRDWYKYGCETQYGDCGAVLMAFDPSFERKIFGIHMAGHLNDPVYTGVGCAIHQETLAKLILALAKRFPESLVDAEVPIPEGGVAHGSRSFEGDFVHLAKVPRQHSAMKSNIKPSPIHGMIAEPVTMPAKLCDFRGPDGERISPLEKARAKASTKNVTLDSKVLDASVDHFKQKLLRNVRKTDARVLSFEEAIAGIEGDEAYKGIKRQTSPGFGWPKSGKGKTLYLGEDDYKFDHPLVLKRYEEMLARVKAGKRSGAVWTDTLKDERRPIEKVMAGKTRLFAASEMTYVILFRRYFMGFAAHMFRNRIDVESCVGVNVYSQEWSHIGRLLKEMGPHVVAGDFTNYDGTLSVEVLWRCLDLITEFYQQGDGWCAEDEAVRTMLWLDIVHSVHVCGDDLYMWSHSQPSGCPITAILNSLYHSIAARYVYVMCARKYAPEYVALSNFSKYVRHINYGDDDVYNIHPEIVDWFNQLTMTEMFKTIGMEYTDEAKTGNLVKVRTLDEIAFLKRKFRWDKDQYRYRAPLSLDTVREMAMWVKRDRNHWELTAETLEEAMLELAQHDRETFDRERPVFDQVRRFVSLRTPCSFNTYEQYQEVEFNKYCRD
jgi:hypothetical protein